ncbi:hypothetical protein ACTFIT_007034 [Dictyostelium discoideum]
MDIDKTSIQKDQAHTTANRPLPYYIEKHIFSEYRTYFHVASNYGISESACYRNIKWVETLYKGPKKSTLLSSTRIKYIDIVTKHPINQNGDISLFYAITTQTVEEVKLTIEKGENITKTDHRGRTPLHYAAFLRVEGAIQLILNKGADVNAKDYLGQTPLHFADRNNHLSIVEQKLSLDNNAKQENINRALVIATIQNNYFIVEFLLDRATEDTISESLFFQE